MCVDHLPNLIFRIGGFYCKNAAVPVDSWTRPDIFVNLLNVRELIVVELLLDGADMGLGFMFGVSFAYTCSLLDCRLRSLFGDGAVAFMGKKYKVEYNY